jgi:uncharacterized membrane protein YdjX (TVP38/TMEM64 family)
MAVAAQSGEHRSRTARALRWVLAALVIMVVGAALWLRLPVDAWLAAAGAVLLGLGGLGVVLFIVVYAMAVLLFAPAAPMTLAAGALYGLWGVPISLAGAMAGAIVAFAIARRWLRGHCAFLCSGHRLSASLDQTVAQLGWRAVLLMRLAPMVPFSWANYAFGMTGIGLRGYWMATLFGMLPATVVKVWLGHAGASALAGPSWPVVALTLAGVVALAALMAVVVRRLRLARATDPGAGA